MNTPAETIKAGIVAAHPELTSLSPEVLEGEIAIFLHRLKLLLETGSRHCACCD
jgi:hypothetical protein